jgi:hypothetical protein
VLTDFIPVWDQVESAKPKQSAEDIMDAIKSMAIKRYDKTDPANDERELFYGDSGDVHP